jgi:hypothetical protein
MAMVRWIVIGAVGVVAFTIYALVDLFMTHAPRVRAFPKPVWIAVVVALPVIGPILWLVLGKAKPRSTKRYSGGRAPDDDPSFLGSLDQESPEDRIRRLEEELRKLDEEDPKDSPDEPETPPTKP